MPHSLSRDDLIAAIQGLTPIKRTILRLHYYESLTDAQIAHRLGLPVEATKKRRQRLLIELRRALEDTSSESI
jgi:RNA polymerase sigma factor (sigma-70 family)